MAKKVRPAGDYGHLKTSTLKVKKLTTLKYRECCKLKMTRVVIYDYKCQANPISKKKKLCNLEVYFKKCHPARLGISDPKKDNFH